MCDIPNDGATATICDTCWPDYHAGWAIILFVCTGLPTKPGLTEIGSVCGVFGHREECNHAYR